MNTPDDQMSDMLVRLHLLPNATTTLDRVHPAGVTVRRAEPADRSGLQDFVEREFGSVWSGGVAVAFADAPRCVLAALASGELVGFALWDVAYRGYLGPMGVAEPWRGRGIGGALLLRVLAIMRDAGYAYAVIGKVGPDAFYERVCGAELIAGEPAP